MEHWAERERWCFGNLTLDSKLPLYVIEICDRSKTISKTGATKIKDIYVDISDTRFFKNSTDGNADFTTRLDFGILQCHGHARDPDPVWRQKHHVGGHRSKWNTWTVLF